MTFNARVKPRTQDFDPHTWELNRSLPVDRSIRGEGLYPFAEFLKIL
jgi:hypothetical protein